MKDHQAELRLALVCYGGVSLAVYMHGVTKELHKLLRAARKFDERPTRNPFEGGTEAVYFDALTDIAKAGPRLVVSIDIIGGTSAGGINGIALSKAIGRNASLEPLKKVWIDQGDIRKLLRGTRIFGLAAQVATTVVGKLLTLFGSSSPLRGEYMSKLLYKALTDMENDRNPDSPSLLPAIAPGLELYVPTTDLNGFEVLVPSGIGGASNRDRDYRQVLVFHNVADDLAQFGADYTVDLAFAGRATSSFPGAFAPVSQASFEDEIGAQAGGNTRLHPETVFLCQYDPDRTADVYFVDGGVLDNAPFDLVVDAIARRRAQTRVYRQLIYIEPDPGQELYSTTREKPADGKRRWLKDLLAVSTVRGSHPILTDLIKLRDMNWRIAEVRAIAEQQERYVKKRTNAVLQRMMSGADDSPQQAAPEGLSTTQLVNDLTAANAATERDTLFQDVSDKVYASARESLGPAWSTYLRLKFEAVLTRLAGEINFYCGFPGPSAKAGFVVAAWIAWARQHDAWQGDNTKALTDLLQDMDMPYRERRLAFILTRINSLYDSADDPNTGPPVDDLNALKAKAWAMVGARRAGTVEAVRRIGVEGGLDFLRLSNDDAVLLDPEDFARANRERFQGVFDLYSTELAQYSKDSEELLTAFQQYTKDWKSKEAKEAKDSLLGSYLGFALWDGILFPTISLSELPQLTPIPVAQFSPLTATALQPPKDGDAKPAKLKGIAVKHFAGFFEAKYRENDYLWGRLDAAEQILRMLADVAKTDASAPAAAATDGAPPHLVDALQAVLDTETDLGRVKDLRAYLGEQVRDLRQGAVTN